MSSAARCGSMIAMKSARSVAERATSDNVLSFFKGVSIAHITSS